MPAHLNTSLVRECVTCGRKLTRTATGRKYCSVKCHKDDEYVKYIAMWKSGVVDGVIGKTCGLSRFIRRYMLEKTDAACEVCGWNMRHPVDGRPLVEINHKDGNARNNCEENLEVLCPNCHSMTPNFRARNKQSARDRSPVSSTAEQ